MDFVSITFLFIIILFSIIGLVKGFTSSIIDFLGEILVLLLSFLITNFLTPIIQNIDFVINKQNSIYNSLVNANSIFGQLFYKENPELISKALQEINIPNILNPFLTNKIVEIIPDEGIILGNILSSLLIQIIVSVVCFIVLFIILKLILILIKKITKKILENVKPINKLDKFLGSVLGAFIGLVIVNVICLLITLSFSMPIFNDLNIMLTEQMCLNNDTWTLSKFIYENNLILLIITWLI